MDPVQSWLDAEEVRRMAESLMAPAPELDSLVADAGYGDGFEGFASATSGGDAGHHEEPSVERKQHVQKAETPEKLQDSDREEEETRRAVVGNALADARRVAEGSGMLQKVETPPAPEAVSAQAPVPEATKESSPEPPQLRSKPEVQSETQREHKPQVAQEYRPPEMTGEHVARGPFLARLQNFSARLRRELQAKAMFLIDNDGRILLDEVGNPRLIQVARTLANASYAATRQTAGSAAVGNLHVKIGASATLEVVPVRSRYGLLVLGVIFPAPLGAARVQQVAELLYRTVEPSKENQ